MCFFGQKKATIRCFLKFKVHSTIIIIFLIKKGDLENIHDLSKWVKEELESIEVDVLDFRTMEKVVQGGNPFVSMFVDDHKKELNSEKAVLKMADKYGIGVAKVDGLAPKYGINIVPTFVYFEDGLPSIFDEEGEELDNDPEGMEYRKKGLYFHEFFFVCATYNLFLALVFFRTF